jgi:hypothetical protein
MNQETALCKRLREGGFPDAAEIVVLLTKALRGLYDGPGDGWGHRSADELRQAYKALIAVGEQVRPRVIESSSEFGPEEEPAVVHTTCRYCELDIEGFAPFSEGEWRDRGNNTHCPNFDSKWHEPVVR